MDGWISSLIIIWGSRPHPVIVVARRAFIFCRGFLFKDSLATEKGFPIPKEIYDSLCIHSSRFYEMCFFFVLVVVVVVVVVVVALVSRLSTSKMTSTIVSSKVFPILDFFFIISVIGVEKTPGDIPLDRHVPQVFVKPSLKLTWHSTWNTRVESDVSFFWVTCLLTGASC